MINFLKCDAKAVIRLLLDLSYQRGREIEHKVIEVDTDTPYKVTVADNNFGITTLNGRIVSFTIGTAREILSCVNQNTKPSIVDTITMDCSDNGESIIKTINVCDIREVIELSDTGIENISGSVINTFR